MGQWYELYGYAIHRRCLRLLGSETEADDALHETFIRAFNHSQEVRESSPLPWLYRICDRVCFAAIDARRRAAAPDPEAALNRLSERPDTRVDLERGRLLRQVLEQCKPGVREVAVLYHVDQMTQDEVAAEAQVSRKTVKQRLAQFRQVAAAFLGLGPGDEEDP